MSQRILLMDDDASILRALRRRLEAEYEVVLASSAVEALRCLEQQGPFCAAVCDIRMPRMSGVEFINEAYKRWPQVRYIVLSGNVAAEGAQEQCPPSAVRRVLRKPCDFSDLKQLLDEASHEGIAATPVNI